MGSFGLLAQVGTRTGLGALLAWVGANTARRLRFWRRGLAEQQRFLRVVETSFLGQNRAVHVIMAGKRSLLIGSTANQIVLLSDVTEESNAAAEAACPPAAEPASQPETAAPPVSVAFAELLAQLIAPPERRRGNPMSSPSNAEGRLPENIPGRSPQRGLPSHLNAQPKQTNRAAHVVVAAPTLRGTRGGGLN